MLQLIWLALPLKQPFFRFCFLSDWQGTLFLEMIFLHRETSGQEKSMADRPTRFWLLVTRYALHTMIITNRYPKSVALTITFTNFLHCNVEEYYAKYQNIKF